MWSVVRLETSLCVALRCVALRCVAFLSMYIGCEYWRLHRRLENTAVQALVGLTLSSALAWSELGGLHSLSLERMISCLISKNESPNMLSAVLCQ